MSKLRDSSNGKPAPSSDPKEPSNGSQPEPRSPYPRPIKPPYGKYLPDLSKRVVKYNGTFNQVQAKRWKVRNWQKAELKERFGYLDESVNGYALERPGLMLQVALLPWMNGEPHHEKETDSRYFEEQRTQVLSKESQAATLQPSEATGSHHPETGSPTLSTHDESSKTNEQVRQPRHTRGYADAVKKIMARAEEHRTTQKSLDPNRGSRLLNTTTSERKPIHARAKNSLEVTLKGTHDTEQCEVLLDTLASGDWEQFYALYLDYHEYVSKYQFTKKPWNVEQFVRAGVIGKLAVNFFEKGEAQSKDRENNRP